MLIVGCTEENQIIDSDKNLSSSQSFLNEHLGVSQQMVSIDEIPEIKQSLEKRSNPKIFEKNNEAQDVWVDLNNILLMVDSTSSKNYSFAISVGSKEPNKFYNLVVHVDNEGKIGEPMVVAFQPKGNHVAPEGELEWYPFDSFFGSDISQKTSCDDQFDSNGDPIPCNVIPLSPSGSGGASSGGSSGGSTGGGVRGNCTIFSYTVRCGGSKSGTWHTPSQCGDEAGGKPGSYVAFEIKCVGGTLKVNASNPECDGCSTNPEGTLGINLNMFNRIKYLLDSSLEGVGLTNEQRSFLLRTENWSLVETLARYWKESDKNNFQKELLNWSIDIEMLPTQPCGVGHDCVKSIQVMANGLRKFHGEDGALMADYFDSLVEDFESFSLNDLQGFYDTAKAITQEYNNLMFVNIFGGFIEGFTPILEIALFEMGTPVAIKLLQKIPISWVYRGVRLNNVVKKVGLLGKQGFNNSIREVVTTSPVTKARELFNSLTKHAISKTNEANGVIKANMGNGNFIILGPLSASSSNVPATISLDFRAAGIWSKVRDIKFLYP